MPIRTNRVGLFSPRLCGSVAYYAAMLRSGRVAIDCIEPYDKHHHLLHRMDVVATNGRQTLSVPLAKPHRGMTVGEVLLSDHGDWRRAHWATLYSAYGRTPFFDYFADELKQILFSSAINGIASLDCSLHSAIISFLDLPIETVVVTHKSDLEGLEMADYRDSAIDEQPLAGEYYQIWSIRHGFQPNLSILDLLFNLGREAIFVLRRGE